MPSPAVAVAVVSWNTRDLLAVCLRSLQPEVESGRAEVWVVDNASTDGSVDLVREAFPWVRLVAGAENVGFGAAVNLVARRTQSEWLAPANADIALEPGALARLLDAGARDLRAGAIAPRLVLPDGATQHSVFAWPTLPWALIFNLGIGRLLPKLGDRLCLVGQWNPETARRVPWAVGAFLLVRRVAWDAAGGFDPDQWMYAEDLDLGWRLTRAGHPTRYEPRAVVAHNESAATRQAWGDERDGRWMEATYEWLRRRRGGRRARATAAINVFGAAARWALFATAAIAVPDPWRHRAGVARRWARLHRDAGLRRPASRLD